MYTSPDDEAGNFEPSHLVSSIQQHYVDDDQQMLLDIEQNIANLEKSKFIKVSLKSIVCLSTICNTLLQPFYYKKYNLFYMIFWNPINAQHLNHS